MRSSFACRWSIAGLIFLSGCAISPVTDDVAHVSASVIARQVRCEARQAVINALLGYLTSPDNNKNKAKLNDYSFNFGLELQRAYDLDHNAIRHFDPSQVTGFASTVTKLLYDTGIAYYYGLLLSVPIIAIPSTTLVSERRIFPADAAISLSTKNSRSNFLGPSIFPIRQIQY